MNFIKETGCFIRYIIYYILRYRKFSSVGIHSVIKKPIRILGGRNIQIGDYTLILNGLRVETLEKWNEQKFHPNLIIGNHVSIGQSVHLVCASQIIIHDYVSIGPFSMINDCTHGYYDSSLPLSVQDISTKPIEVGEGTIVGMSVCILPGVKIGKHCYIGANTTIAKDIPDNTIVSAQMPRKVQIPY